MKANAVAAAFSHQGEGAAGFPRLGKGKGVEEESFQDLFRAVFAAGKAASTPGSYHLEALDATGAERTKGSLFPEQAGRHLPKGTDLAGEKTAALLNCKPLLLLEAEGGEPAPGPEEAEALGSFAFKFLWWIFAGEAEVTNEAEAGASGEGMALKGLFQKLMPEGLRKEWDELSSSGRKLVALILEELVRGAEGEEAILFQEKAGIKALPGRFFAGREEVYPAGTPPDGDGVGGSISLRKLPGSSEATSTAGSVPLGRKGPGAATTAAAGGAAEESSPLGKKDLFLSRLAEEILFRLQEKESSQERLKLFIPPGELGQAEKFAGKGEGSKESFNALLSRVEKFIRALFLGEKEGVKLPKGSGKIFPAGDLGEKTSLEPESRGLFVNGSQGPLPEGGRADGKASGFNSPLGSGAGARVDPEDILAQVVGRINLLQRPGEQEMRLRLKPESLGEVIIRVRRAQGVLSAEIITQNPVVKEALEGQLEALRQRFQQANLNVEEFYVLVGDERRDGAASGGETKGESMPLGRAGKEKPPGGEDKGRVFSESIGRKVDYLV